MGYPPGRPGHDRFAEKRRIMEEAIQRRFELQVATVLVELGVVERAGGPAMSTPAPIRPECLDEDHLAYLDMFRESGATNMFGAQPYLEREFPDLTRRQARAVLVYWMETFAERRPPD